VTSAGAAPSFGTHILMSYLPPERANIDEQLMVEYMGERYPVTVVTNDSTPLFDPDNLRVRS
jgi:glycine cleavage system aminomethyltransferase T